jgi:hypothetical protein
MIGMDPKVPGNVDVPSLEDIAYGHVERAIEKAESATSGEERNIPTFETCVGCHDPIHVDYSIGRIRYNSKGETIDTIKYDKNYNLDTISNKNITPSKKTSDKP